MLQDKDGKVAYLTKIINVVSICLNQPVAAKPLKVGLLTHARMDFFRMPGCFDQGSKDHIRHTTWVQELML